MVSSGRELAFGLLSSPLIAIKLEKMNRLYGVHWSSASFEGELFLRLFRFLGRRGRSIQEQSWLGDSDVNEY